MSSVRPIRFDDVTLAYRRHPAVHHLSGNFQPGSLTAIAGPNGAGKSTLVKALMGEIRVSEGGIDLGGRSCRDFGYLPQAAEIDRQFPLTVADAVMLGGWARFGAFGRLTSDIEEKATRALQAVGLEGFGARTIGTLSAGQFQRVLFARLLLQDASVIVLDEPFTAIDARTTRDLLDLVLAWHGEGRTVIAVLHDFDQIRECFPQTLLIAREMIHWGETKEALAPDNLLRARAMAERFDEAAGPCAGPARKAG